MNKLKAGPKRVVLLVDNTRGHFHQSQGIARWLERLCGAEIHEIRVPILTGVKRFLVLKMQGRSLDSASPEEAREWLKKAGFSIEDHADILSGGPGTLFMATGNSASSFCLALAKALKGFSAVIMTPDVVGTQPFDFAIVPEHDRRKRRRHFSVRRNLSLTRWSRFCWAEVTPTMNSRPPGSGLSCPPCARRRNSRGLPCSLRPRRVRGRKRTAPWRLFLREALRPVTCSWRRKARKIPCLPCWARQPMSLSRKIPCPWFQRLRRPDSGWDCSGLAENRHRRRKSVICSARVPCALTRSLRKWPPEGLWKIWGRPRILTRSWPLRPAGSRRPLTRQRELRNGY